MDDDFDAFPAGTADGLPFVEVDTAYDDEYDYAFNDIGLALRLIEARS
jgi:hypothetical protein